MALYKLNKIGVLLQDATNPLDIPKDDRNRHWQDYQKWLADGNVPDAANPEPALPTELENATAALQRDPVFRALVKVLATHFGLTPKQMVDEIKAQV